MRARRGMSLARQLCVSRFGSKELHDEACACMNHGGTAAGARLSHGTDAQVNESVASGSDTAEGENDEGHSLSNGKSPDNGKQASPLVTNYRKWSQKKKCAFSGQFTVLNSNFSSQNIQPSFRTVSQGVAVVTIRNIRMYRCAQYECRFCHETIGDFKSICKHMCDGRRLESDSKQRAFLKKDVMYKCYYCKRPFVNRIECWTHSTQDCSKKPEGVDTPVMSQCPYCEKESYGFWGLQRHAAMTHGKCIQLHPTKGLIELHMDKKYRKPKMERTLQSKKMLEAWGRRRAAASRKMPDGVSIYGIQQVLRDMQLGDATLPVNFGAAGPVEANARTMNSGGNNQPPCYDGETSDDAVSSEAAVDAATSVSLCDRHSKPHAINMLTHHVSVIPGQGQSQIKCRYCQVSMNSLHGLSSHLLNSHPQEFAVSSKSCPTCDHESFAEEFNLKNYRVELKRTRSAPDGVVTSAKKQLCPMSPVISVRRLGIEFRPGCVTTINLTQLPNCDPVADSREMQGEVGREHLASNIASTEQTDAGNVSEMASPGPRVDNALPHVPMSVCNQTRSTSLSNEVETNLRTVDSALADKDTQRTGKSDFVTDIKPMIVV